MKRPSQHIIDAKGETLMRSVLQPSGWVINSVQTDYGIDFDVEVFYEHESTGVFFKVQLKSSENTNYSAQKDFISQRIKIESAHYLCREVRTPVILIHADVLQGRVFWFTPQLDPEKIELLSTQSEQDSITLRIPTSNLLPETIALLADAVAQVETVLASRAITHVSIPDFLGNVEGHIDADQFILEVQDKSDALRLQKASRLFVAREFEEVKKLADKVLRNSAASVHNKFWALLITERTEIWSQARAGAPQAIIPATHLKISKQLQLLTRDGPSHLKFFALIARKAAELEHLAFQDMGLFMAWETGRQKGDTGGHSMTDIAIRRTGVTHKLNLLHRQCVRLVNYAAGFRLRPALSVALLRIVKGMALYRFRLEADGMHDLAQEHLRVAFEICSRVRDIALSVKDDYALNEASSTVMLLALGSNIDVARWAKETIAQIGNEDIRADALARFERDLRRIHGQPVEGDMYGEPTETQIKQNIKSALEADTLE